MSKKIIDYSKYGETKKSLSKWLNIIKNNRISLYYQISHLIPPNSTAIEIGAGSAWLSSLCSQHKNINKISAIEIDERRLYLAKKYFCHHLNANQAKISFINSDFHKLQFIKNNSIDIVFIDAALHHTNTLKKLLNELHRVLNNKGRIIAIREPILPSLPILKQFRKITFGHKQIKCGDIENIYSKKEWSNYFNKCNFNITFHPTYGDFKKDKLLSKAPINKFNGILFNRYYIIATKKYLDT